MLGCVEFAEELGDFFEPTVDNIDLSLTEAMSATMSRSSCPHHRFEDPTHCWEDRWILVRFCLGFGGAWVHGMLTWAQWEQGMFLSQRIYNSIASVMVVLQVVVT